MSNKFVYKIKKKEKKDKTPYTLYNPHKGEQRAFLDTKEGYLQVVSIDPATNNYALRIERRGTSETNRTITTLVFTKVNISDCSPQSKKIKASDAEETFRVYDTLTKFLDRYKSFFMESHYIIIERQLPYNYKAVRISQHTLSYFLLTLRDAPLLPIILEVNPQLKTKLLGAPKYVNIKDWSVDHAKDLLTWRGDRNGLEMLIKAKKKADDLADTVCQIEAIFRLKNLPLTREPTRIVIVQKKPTITIVNSEDNFAIEKNQSISIKSLLNDQPKINTSGKIKIVNDTLGSKVSTGPIGGPSISPEREDGFLKFNIGLRLNNTVIRLLETPVIAASKIEIVGFHFPRKQFLIIGDQFGQISPGLKSLTRTRIEAEANNLSLLAKSDSYRFQNEKEISQPSLYFLDAAKTVKMLVRVGIDTEFDFPVEVKLNRPQTLVPIGQTVTVKSLNSFSLIIPDNSVQIDPFDFQPVIRKVD